LGPAVGGFGKESRLAGCPTAPGAGRCRSSPAGDRRCMESSLWVLKSQTPPSTASGCHSERQSTPYHLQTCRGSGRPPSGRSLEETHGRPKFPQPPPGGGRRMSSAWGRSHVRHPTQDHLYWPQLEADFSIESMRKPETFRLVSRSAAEAVGSRGPHKAAPVANPTCGTLGNARPKR